MSTLSTQQKSKQSLARSDEVDVEIEALRFPPIRCIDDIINNFFNQIVQYVVEDMIVVEPTDANDVTESVPSQETITKDYKDLQTQDLAGAEITNASGSKVTLSRKSSARSVGDFGKVHSNEIKQASLRRLESSSRKVAKTSVLSNLEVITEETDPTRSKTSTTVTSSLQDPLMEEEREVKIIFISGNVYEGKISKRIMNGKGTYYWTDGTVYEGDFKDGFPTGKGKMTLPDLSHFEGEFNEGLFHGSGFLNIVSTPAFYSGEWKNGLKHGQGWLLYEPGDWFEGAWAKDLKDGFGIRYYKNGAKYRGSWGEGKPDGDGTMIWETGDYYKGGWSKGAMHGDGEYIWKAFYNPTFAFPLETIYRGAWQNGRRCGKGVLLLGDDSGIKIKGSWDQDFKHGDGNLICGNGRVITQDILFSLDKPIETSEVSASSIACFHSQQILDVPIFTAPELVNVGPYVDQILAKLQNVNPEKLKPLKIFEEKGIKNTIIRFLPQLKELYQDYAHVATKIRLQFEPVMVRLFLWQMYKDIDIHKRGVSLAKTDEILAEHPYSCVENVHDPFEGIYFYQFLMSLIGVALATASLEEIYDNPGEGGVSAFIVKKFFEDVIFAKPPDHAGSLLLSYLDLAPLKSVYLLYGRIGEPHSARTFLQHCCTRKGEVPILCLLELQTKAFESSFGTNVVPLAEYVTFDREKPVEMDDWLKHNWTNLFDFRNLGPKSVVRCLSKVGPLIVSEGLIVDIDYPLTFLEFYESVLTCIFMVLELEMKKEQKILWQSVPTPATTVSTQSKPTSSVQKTASRKKVSKGQKKGDKKKKRA